MMVLQAWQLQHRCFLSINSEILHWYQRSLPINFVFKLHLIQFMGISCFVLAAEHFATKNLLDYQVSCYVLKIPDSILKLVNFVSIAIKTKNHAIQAFHCLCSSRSCRTWAFVCTFHHVAGFQCDYHTLFATLLNTGARCWGFTRHRQSKSLPWPT